MAKLERAWRQNTMAAEYNFCGAQLTVSHTVEIGPEQMLAFIADNWLRIDVRKRDAFKRRVQKIELGVEEMPEPDDMPEEPPIRW